GELATRREAGVEVERYTPLVWFKLARRKHRDHRKLLIVDGKIGFIGGAGLADIWQGNADAPKHWRDSQFRLEGPAVGQMQAAFIDRKSTRLNSSHQIISYAVFCLKKKKNK